MFFHKTIRVHVQKKFYKQLLIILCHQDYIHSSFYCVILNLGVLSQSHVSDGCVLINVDCQINQMITEKVSGVLSQSHFSNRMLCINRMKVYMVSFTMKFLLGYIVP